MSKAKETEKGYRWWIRYVIVPIIGSGGLIAIIVALIVRSNSFPSHVPGITNSTETVRTISVELNGPICEYKKGDFAESTALLSVVNFNKLKELGAQVGDRVTVTITGNDFSNFVPELKLGTDPTLGKCVMRMERVIFKGLDAQLVDELEVDLNQRHDYLITVTVK